MKIENILALAGIGAVITTVGNLIALYLKDYIGSRSFEQWKRRQELIALYDRYRKPITVAAQELSNRCSALAEKRFGPRGNNGIEMLHTRPIQTNTAAVNDHFFRYRFMSDAYRLCCFFGWMELYRRDLGFWTLVPSGRIESSIDAFRTSDGISRMGTSTLTRIGMNGLTC